MSKRNKLLHRFLSKPRDFTFKEFETLLRRFGYEKVPTGSTAGLRVAFFNPGDGHVIRLHRPHPADILKSYQLEEIEASLRAKGRLS